jgi:glycogen operon protein
MWDMFSYNTKHNEANGEDGRDGCDDNLSWNCGIEGETDDQEVVSLRNRQMKNAFTILLTSRGVPMILSGDEFANTQYGNNNAYCQDNEISWLNWDDYKKHRDIFDHVRKLIAFRNAHPVLRNASYDSDRNGTDYPELSFHSEKAWQFDIMGPGLCFAYMFVEDHVKYSTAADAFIYVALNAHWENHTMELPIIPADKKWHTVADSFNGKTYSPGREPLLKTTGCVDINPRSSLILIAR